MPRGGVMLTNTTEQAFAGTRSLRTTGRTAGFMGPSLPLDRSADQGRHLRCHRLGAARRR